MKDREQRRWYYTPCGLDCYGCSIRLRVEEELNCWADQNVDPEKIRCGGCRSERSENHWSPGCKILQCCVYERGLEFCVQCLDFPCQIMGDWGKEYEHHAQAVADLKAMKELGVEQWFKKKGVT
jgi:hypothetical protein